MRSLCLTLYITGWLALSTWAAPPVEVVRKGQGKATITFYGTSTLHDFSGTVACDPFDWEIQKDPNGMQVIHAQPVVQVLKMTTAHKKRDRNMYNMFQSKTYASIQGKIKASPLSLFLPKRKTTASGKQQEVPGTLHLTLTIRDRSCPLVGHVTRFKTSTKQSSFTVDFETSLKKFGLKPPSVFGIIRVGDTVRVKMEVVLTEKKIQTATSTTSLAPAASTP